MSDTNGRALQLEARGHPGGARSQGPARPRQHLPRHPPEQLASLPAALRARTPKCYQVTCGFVTLVSRCRFVCKRKKPRCTRTAKKFAPIPFQLAFCDNIEKYLAARVQRRSSNCTRAARIAEPISRDLGFCGNHANSWRFVCGHCARGESTHSVLCHGCATDGGIDTLRVSQCHGDGNVCILRMLASEPLSEVSKSGPDIRLRSFSSTVFWRLGCHPLDCVRGSVSKKLSIVLRSIGGFKGAAWTIGVRAVLWRR